MHYDVFNGDADGLCAIHQLRLAAPRDGVLISGVKRDITLLQRVPQDATSVRVCDVSLAVNRRALDALLARGVSVEYFDHHDFGETLPEHPALRCHINTAPTVCTGLIANGHLGGRYRAWAAVAAYGDNMHQSAAAVLRPLALTETRRAALEQLGLLLNYNGYGTQLEDLWFDPCHLLSLMPEDPWQLLADPALRQLDDGYQQDLAHASQLRADHRSPSLRAYLLPDQPWARRVVGTLVNRLAREQPDVAHLIAAPSDNGLTVSIRAPKARPQGAGALARHYPNGGGRAAAAGINALPVSQWPALITLAAQHFQP